MVRLKYGRPPKIGIVAYPCNCNGVCIKSIWLRHILVNAVEAMRNAQQFAALGKTQYGRARHPQALGLRCPKKAIVAYGFIENSIIRIHGAILYHFCPVSVNGRLV